MLANIRRSIARRTKQAADAGRSLGLLPSHSDYQRFIVLGRGRSGSNLLTTSLDSHPQVLAFGELFNNLARDKGTIHWRNSGYDPADARMVQLRAEHPVEFIEQAVFAPMPLRIQAVGFKLFYYHAQDAQWQAVWPYLQAQNVKAIHITRQDLLASLVSETYAQSSKRWSNRGGGVAEPATREPLTLSEETCRTYFESIASAREAFSTKFPETFEVVYEDLAADPVPVLQGVQEFLGVEQRSLSSRFRKQAKGPVSESITNFDELREAFANSPWSGFFR